MNDKMPTRATTSVSQDAPTLRTASRFGVIGIINTGITYAIYCTLVAFGLYYNLAAVIGYLAGLMNSYFFNKRWTFSHTKQHSSGLIAKFITVNMMALGTNLLLLTGLISGVGVNEYVAQLLTMGFTTVINYLGCRCWVFRTR